MTNRNKNAKRPRLRFLDLSFEGRDLGRRTGIDNGRRPHGGYRGTKKHPPTPYTPDRNYPRSIREELDRLFDDEFFEFNGSPSWSVEASKESNHSGESPLFIHGFLSAGKIDGEYIRQNRSACSSPSKCQPPMSRDGVTYYRPNRTHQYLTATELKDQSQNEVNLKYGRPTRTTLLRARQRSNSVPVNSYEVRRETMKREEEIRASSAYTNPKEFLQDLYSNNGESYHSFITGARYNRAHCLDAKTLNKYGVYMPRNNPTACFVTAGHKLRDIFDIPSAPPDSPRSDVDDVSTPMVPRRPTTAPGYGRRPTPNATGKPKEAWGDENEAVLNNESRVYEELIFWPSGLNVKGRNLEVALKQNAGLSRLPTVQGISMERMRKSRDTVDEMSVINQPPPSPMATSQKDGADKLSQVPDEKSKASAEETKKEPIIVQRKPKPILVDRAVNVPSVSGDSHHWNDEALIVSACAVPQTKPISEKGFVKAVSFHKTIDPKKEETKEEKKEQQSKEGHEEVTEPIKVTVNVDITPAGEGEAGSCNGSDTNQVAENDVSLDGLKSEEPENTSEKGKDAEDTQPDLKETRTGDVKSDLDVTEVKVNDDVANVDTVKETSDVTFFLTEESKQNVHQARVDGYIRAAEGVSLMKVIGDNLDIPIVKIEDFSETSDVTDVDKAVDDAGKQTAE